MNSHRSFSITENNFTYEIQRFETDVYITAKSDIDKRIWKVVITDDNNIGLDNNVVYDILDCYSKGDDEMQKYFIIEFPKTPKDKTGDLLIIITSIHYFKSQEKHYQISLKLGEFDDIERLEERIAELRHICDNHSDTIESCRSLICEKDNEIQNLTSKTTEMQAMLDVFVNNFKLLEKKYGFKFNSDNYDDDPQLSDAESSDEVKDNPITNFFESGGYMSDGLIECIKMIETRLELFEADINNMKDINSILSERIITMEKDIKHNNKELSDKIIHLADNFNNFSDNAESRLNDLDDDVYNLKSNIESTQKAGSSTKKHIESIHQRLNHISELCSSGYANTSKKLKEEYLSRSPSSSWNDILINRGNHD
jgi:predicted  nucleic acid-binding Zn-ribbon protein